MRWLLLKDLQILRRSPLLLALLVLYPIAVSVLIGLALSRGPDKPAVAFLNQVPESQNVISVGGEEVDVSRYADQLFQSIQPVRVSSRAEAVEKVRDGDVLAALIIPSDITQKLEAGLEPAEVEVLYNAEDPVKASFVQDTIKAQVQDANAVLSDRLIEVATGYLELIVAGGEFSLLGRSIEVLGLESSEEILAAVREQLPAGSPERERVDQVVQFARLASENLSLADDVLASVGTPIAVRTEVVEGGRTPLSSFAAQVALVVSLMFVALLLASGTLALERDENAFQRITRGLVSRTGLLVEKAGLAAGCAVLSSLLMLAGLTLFVDLEWSRFPLWVAALAMGALAFGSMGVAVGALAREVTAASLLAFMISLPIAFLALVPSGAISGAFYDAVRIVTALFPFGATLDGLDAAMNDSGGLARALIHLAALIAGFGALARLALRRFA